MFSIGFDLSGLAELTPRPFCNQWLKVIAPRVRCRICRRAHDAVAS
jgi:hypothetical protein